MLSEMVRRFPPPRRPPLHEDGPASTRRPHDLVIPNPPRRRTPQDAETRDRDSSLAPNQLRSSGHVLQARKTAADGLIGQLVEGRFRIASVIGAGGMGVVFSAVDVDSGQEIALKVLHPSAFNSENLRRFRRERRAAHALRHPNVCQVFGSGTVKDGSPYIVMERLHGETLRSRLYEEGPMALGDAISVALQLLDGLSGSPILRTRFASGLEENTVSLREALDGVTGR